MVDSPCLVDATNQWGNDGNKPFNHHMGLVTHGLNKWGYPKQNHLHHAALDWSFQRHCWHRSYHVSRFLPTTTISSHTPQWLVKFQSAGFFGGLGFGDFPSRILDKDFFAGSDPNAQLLDSSDIFNHLDFQKSFRNSNHSVLVHLWENNGNNQSFVPGSLISFTILNSIPQ